MKRKKVQYITALCFVASFLVPQGAVLAHSHQDSNQDRLQAMPESISQARNANRDSGATDSSENEGAEDGQSDNSGLTPGQVKSRLQEQQDIFKRRREAQDRYDRRQNTEKAIENGDTVPARVEEQADGTFRVVVPEGAIDQAVGNEDELSGVEAKRQRAKERRRRFLRPEFEAQADGATLEGTAEQVQKFFGDSGNNLEGFTRLPEEKRAKLKEIMENTASELRALVEELKSTTDPDRKEELRAEIRAFLESKREARKRVIEESITLPEPPSLKPVTEISERMEKLSDRLAEFGADTTDFEANLSELTDSIAAASDLAETLKEEPSIESVTALRDQLGKIKTLREQMRNQIQSLITEIKSNS